MKKINLEGLGLAKNKKLTRQQLKSLVGASSGNPWPQCNDMCNYWKNDCPNGLICQPWTMSNGAECLRCV